MIVEQRTVRTWPPYMLMSFRLLSGDAETPGGTTAATAGATGDRRRFSGGHSAKARVLSLSFRQEVLQIL